MRNVAPGTGSLSQSPAVSTPPVRLLLVVGPHGGTGGVPLAPAGGTATVEALAATLTRVDAPTEGEAVAALARPCEAVVLDPGVLEHYSQRLADAVRRLDVPVVVVHPRQEGDGGLAPVRVVTPAAAASISGGGPLAYEAAVEAAAALAWDRRT